MPNVLPEHITLQTATRPYFPGFYHSLDSIEAPDHLPQLMCLGLVDPASFSRDYEGWRVRYADPSANDTYLEVEYERETDTLHAASSWRGLTGRSGEIEERHDAETEWDHSARWSFLVGAVFRDGPAPLWHAIQQRRVQNAYNVRYLPRPAKWGYVFLPSGVLQRVVCMVSVARLTAAVGLLDDMQCDDAIISPVTADIVLGTSTVNYLEGLCPDGPQDRHDAVRRVRDETGLVPDGMPEWEVNKAGVRALTVRRRHYSLDIGCAFADTERVLAHLHAAGFVGGARPRKGEAGHSSAPENCAFLLPDAATGAWGAQFNTEDGSRRVTYPPFERGTESEKALDRRTTSSGHPDDMIPQAIECAAAEWEELAL